MLGQGLQMGRGRIDLLLAQIEGLDAIGQFLPLGRGFQGPQIQKDPLPRPSRRVY